MAEFKIRLASGAEVICETPDDLREALQVIEEVEGDESPLRRRTNEANLKRAIGQKARWERARQIAEERNITIGEARSIAAREEKERQAAQTLGISTAEAKVVRTKKP